MRLTQTTVTFWARSQVRKGCYAAAFSVLLFCRKLVSKAVTFTTKPLTRKRVHGTDP